MNLEKYINIIIIYLLEAKVEETRESTKNDLIVISTGLRQTRPNMDGLKMIRKAGG